MQRTGGKSLLSKVCQLCWQPGSQLEQCESFWDPLKRKPYRAIEIQNALVFDMSCNSKTGRWFSFWTFVVCSAAWGNRGSTMKLETLAGEMPQLLSFRWAQSNPVTSKVWIFAVKPKCANVRSVFENSTTPNQWLSSALEKLHVRNRINKFWLT